MHKFILIFAIVAAMNVTVPAQDAAAPAPPSAPPSAPPATRPSTAPAAPVDVVADKDKLKSLIGQDVTVRGKVVEVFQSQRSGITILNFFPPAQRRDFNVVIDKANLDAVNAGHNGDVAAAVRDQIILITGTITEYRGNPQIQVEKPEQIKLEPAKPD